MKTYLPRLRFVLLIVCRYILRYNDKIKQNLPGSAAPAVDAALSACQILIAILDGEIPDET